MTVDRRIVDLYNEYVHTALPRRAFLDRLAKIAGGTAAALAVLPLIEPNYAEARQTEPDDKRLSCERIQFNGPNGPVKAYTARPTKLKRSNKIPGVLVIHENRGLNEHIEDVARRTALAGYVAVAPDGLSVAGGAPVDQEAARDLFAKQDPERIASDVLAGVPWLAADYNSNGKIGVVGFCYGGGIANLLATRIPDLGGAVPFYGSQPPAEEVSKIKAPLLIHYAENDERINAGIPAFQAALDAAKVKYQIFKYPGTQHGFNNDTTPRFDKAAAALAWKRTIDFFNKHLRTAAKG
jgi:carboxymethylenebutenolidase